MIANSYQSNHYISFCQHLVLRQRSDILQIDLTRSYYLAENYELGLLRQVEYQGFRMNECFLAGAVNFIPSIFGQPGSGIHTPFRHALDPILDGVRVQRFFVDFS